jgi:CDP-diacylglycerol--serine O-phosphatidyltransferase
MKNSNSTKKTVAKKKSAVTKKKSTTTEQVADLKVVKKESKLVGRLIALKRFRPPVKKSWIPNTFTLLSLFFGFSSILASIQSVKEVVYLMENLSLPYLQRDADPKRYLAFAGFCIILGTVLDLLDGMLARALGVSSEFGKHLDSMADLVTFGIAPGVLFYTVTLYAGHSFRDTGINYHVDPYLPDFLINNLFLIKLLAFAFPICAVIRLARFNNLPNLPYFVGVPSTFAGGAVALFLSFTLTTLPAITIFHFLTGDVLNLSMVNGFTNAAYGLFNNFLFLLLTTLCLAFLMVSEIRFYKVRYFLSKFKGKSKVVFLVSFFVLAVLFYQYVLALTALFYFCFSVIRHFYFKFYPSRADY